MNNLLADLSNVDVNTVFDFINAPSFKGLQLALIVYVGLLWLSVIIWVTRDSINRSESILFQAFSIIINISFPILGIFLYLIIRPGKTTTERYYEDLEHKLILEKIEKKPARTSTSREKPKTEDRKIKKATSSRKKVIIKKTTKRKVVKK